MSEPFPRPAGLDRLLGYVEARLTGEPGACGNCSQPFDPADTRFDGLARYGETPFCRRCADHCHDSGDAFHVCAMCR